EAGGHLTLGPAGDAALARRRYRNGSTVLETAWRVDGAEVVLTDGMIAEVQGSLFPTLCLVRRIEARGGTATCTLAFDPRFGVHRRAPRTRAAGGVLVCAEGGTALSFAVDCDLPLRPGRAV